jgi:hypothetical protein
MRTTGSSYAWTIRRAVRRMWSPARRLITVARHVVGGQRAIAESRNEAGTVRVEQRLELG